jgi:hypothetical protein
VRPATLVVRRGEAASTVVEAGSFRVEAELGGRLAAPGLRLTTVPEFGPKASWEVLHACPVRADLMCQSPSRDGSVTLDLVVTLHAGCSRIDLVLVARASRQTILPGGAGVRLHTDAPWSLGLGDVAPVEEGIRVERRAERWWDGEADRGSAALDQAELVPGWGAHFPSGMTWIDANPDSGEAFLAWEAPGIVLEAGEGRVWRGSIGEGKPPPPWPMVVPRNPVSEAGGGTKLRPASARNPLDGVVVRFLESFLDDPEAGPFRLGQGRGDWPFDRQRVGNLEYDTTLGLLLFAIRHRDGDAYTAALRAADHLIGVDFDAGGSGLFFPHGLGHRSGPVEVGHHWIEGLMLLDAWLDDPTAARILDAVLQAQVVTLGRLDLERELPRSLGWGLLALAAAGHRAGPHRLATRKEVLRWRRHLLMRQGDAGILRLVPIGGGERLWQENPYVQGGIILPALARSLAVVPSGRDGAATQRLATAWAEHGVFEAEGVWHLARRLVLDDRGRVIAANGSAPGESGALFLSGLFSARPGLRRSPALLALLAGIPDTLRLPKKRYRGAELSVLLRSVPWLDL